MICLAHIKSPSDSASDKKIVQKEKTNIINLNKIPLSKEKNSTCEDLILAHCKLEVGGLIAKFESLLRFFVSILGNTWERTVRKALAQSYQTR